jgi:hypothetical protein
VTGVEALTELVWLSRTGLTEVLTHYYDVTADGQKFLFSLPAQKTTSSFHVMLDWAAALKH